MWRTGILAAALLLAWPVQSAAQTGEEALRAGLAEARRLIDAGEFKQGHTIVLALVDEHADEDYMLLHVHRIKEQLKLAAFWATHERPKAEELISGDLKSYNKRSGKIKVEYSRSADAERDDDEDEDKDGRNTTLRELLELLGLGTSLDASDFTWAFGVPMHPIVFDGPYTVEVSGRLNDRNDIFGMFYGSPQIMINAGDEGFYQILFGYPANTYGWRNGASITHIQGDKREELDSDRGTPLEIGKKYTVKINVSSKYITASGNGRTFLKAKKKGKSFGQFGFRGCPNITGLVLNGQANTAWLEGLADSWVEDAWNDFDEVYDPLDELSTDFADRVGKAAKPLTGLLPEYPGNKYPGNAEFLETFEDFAKKGDYKKIINYMADVSPSKTSEGFRLFLYAVVNAHLGERTECLAFCDDVIEKFPEFVPAHLLRVNMLASLEQTDEAIEELQGLISQAAGDEPPDARLHVALATMLVHRGDNEGAKETMMSAIDAGVAPAELEGVAFMLTRARYGPEWSVTHEFKSKSYMVQSDLSEKVCVEASKALEQSLSMYDRLFGRARDTEDSPERYLVYIFSGAAGYMKYAGDLFGSAPVNTAGLYSPVLKQLLIWNLPDHEMMMRTIRHEGFHQYLDKRVGDSPTWINEGTAQYLETAKLSRGKMTPGTPHMGNVLRLTQKGTRWVKLRELVRMTPSEFYSNPGLHYPEAWALVHYLLESGRDEKKMYEACMEALIEGADREAIAERGFAGVSWNVLERDVKAHVKALIED
jgi:hypothetical protein